MQEHEARVRAFYDHEVEEPRTTRRRRQVADWGVGEDVFDRMPSRRFSRTDGAHARRGAEAPAQPARPRDVDLPGGREARDAEAPLGGPRDAGTPGPAAGDETAAVADAHPARRPARLPAPRAQVPDGRTDDGRRTIVIGEPRDEEVAVAVDGRRTVVIGARRADPSPRRPPRRGAERVGPRPDRIVAYAVALGVLLILIAILSAGH